MDYPKSVPSIGLVNGKFVNENTATGTPGSLIPAEWGNSVTEELLKVITQAGLLPDEANHQQLNLAILQLISSKTPQATELLLGVMKIASQVLADAGADDATAISPKKLKWGFAASLAQTGYIRLPTWLGSVTFQWGITANIPAGSSATTLFPTAFATSLFSVVTTYSNPSANVATGGSPHMLRTRSNTGFAVWNGGNSDSQYTYFAVGA